MSVNADIPCKLPLLDGDKSSENELLRRDISHSNAVELLQSCKHDLETIEDTLCAAWSLLLRVYTGQNDGSFGLIRGGSAGGVKETDGQTKTVNYNVDENDTLSRYLQRLRETRAFGLANGSASAGHRTAPISYNTSISIDKAPSQGKESKDTSFSRHLRSKVRSDFISQITEGT